MFKSIFIRLLVTYLLITIFVISSMTFIVAFIYKNTVFEEERDNLELVAERANNLTQDFYNQRISEKELNSAINAMGYSTESVIYILKTNKQQFNEHQELLQRGLNEEFIVHDLRLVLDGQKVFRNEQYSAGYGSYVLFTGYPLTINGKVEGAILLLCPIDNINQNIARMNLIIWIVAVAMIIVSVPFIYLNSRRISKPIKEMETTARKIASGEKADHRVLASKDEIGRLSNSFKYMKDQIEKTEKMRQELIADVSHELRTPLTSINGFVQAIIDGVIDPEDQREYLLLIQEEAKRLIRLTSDLLDLAKLQSGGIELHKERINLFTVVEGILAVFSTTAKNKRLSMANRIDTALYVTADPSALKQVLINIVSNAIKYSLEEGAIIVRAEEEHNIVRLAVCDNGIGITEEDLLYIFEKFYRSDRVRNSEDKSSGLGLAIAKNLVELSGGSIWVDSTVGNGTSVIFTLPVCEKVHN